LTRQRRRTVDWIEKVLGISPDGGSGLTEFVLLVALVCLIAGIVLRGRAVHARRRRGPP
jgi:hypothetical protein